MPCGAGDGGVKELETVGSASLWRLVPAAFGLRDCGRTWLVITAARTRSVPAVRPASRGRLHPSGWLLLSIFLKAYIDIFW
jgi:hypothetical protein